MVTSNSADIVRCLREFAAYGEDSRGRVLAQLALTEIERLRPYVEAFRREETRADKLGQEIDDLRASLTTASGEAATLQEGWDNTAHFVGINFDDEETRTLLSEISRLRKENSDLAARLTGVAQARPACKAECDGQMQLAMAEIERLEALRETTIEECAQVAEAQKETFLSPQYDSNQPFGSLCERFACDEVAKAIRALAVTSPHGK